MRSFLGVRLAPLHAQTPASAPARTTRVPIEKLGPETPENVGKMFGLRPSEHWRNTTAAAARPWNVMGRRARVLAAQMMQDLIDDILLRGICCVVRQLTSPATRRDTKFRTAVDDLA
jgi:hypothetical protein